MEIQQTVPMGGRICVRGHAHSGRLPGKRCRPSSLGALVADRNNPQKRAWRAEIILPCLPWPMARTVERSCSGLGSRSPASGVGKNESMVEGVENRSLYLACWRLSWRFPRGRANAAPSTVTSTRYIREDRTLCSAFLMPEVGWA